MRIVLFLLTCFFMFQLSSSDNMDNNVVDNGLQLTEESYNSLSAEEQAQLAGSVMTDESDCPDSPMVRCNLSSLALHMRVLSARIQFRCQANQLLVKKLIHALSDFYDVQQNRCSLTYSTLKRTSWQYASDCYVFGIRQILI